MIIELTADYRLRIIPLNVVLQRQVARVKKKTQEEYLDWEDRGYYRTIQDAIKSIPGDVVLENSCAEYLELCNRINAIADELGKRL